MLTTPHNVCDGSRMYGVMSRKCLWNMPPPRGPISLFLFLFSFLGKIDQIIAFHAHLRSWRPREILDLPLRRGTGYFNFIWFNFFKQNMVFRTYRREAVPTMTTHLPIGLALSFVVVDNQTWPSVPLGPHPGCHWFSRQNVCTHRQVSLVVTSYPLMQFPTLISV